MDILKTIPTFMSLRLVSENLKKRKKKGLVKQGIDNIIGIDLIREAAKYSG